MTWNWYDINSYKASVGGTGYHGAVQLFGDEFVALIKFQLKESEFNASAPAIQSQRFYAHLDYQQMQMFVDLLHNETSLRFGWNDAHPEQFHLMAGETVLEDSDDEGDGFF